MVKPRFADRQRSNSAACRDELSNEHLRKQFDALTVVIGDLASRAKLAGIDTRHEVLAELQASLPMALTLRQIQERLHRERFELTWLAQLLEN